MPISESIRAGLVLCRAFVFFAILPLSACLAETGGGGLKFLVKPGDGAARQMHKATLFHGNVVVAAPDGYCIDPASLVTKATGGFALLASCESLANTPDTPGTPVQPAVMTVSVLPREPGVQQPTAEELAASMAPAEALEGHNRDGLSLVRLSSGGDGLLPGGNPRHWRGVMLINGHLTGLAVYSPLDSKMGADEGRQLVLDLAESLRKHSRARHYDPPPDVADEDAVAGDVTKETPKETPKEATKATAGASTALTGKATKAEAKDIPKSLAQRLGGLFPIPD